MMKHTRLFTLIILCIVTLQVEGCTVGYRTFTTDVADARRADFDLSDYKISYNINNPLFQLSLERILRGRFHARDLRPSPETEEPARFLVSTDIISHRMSIVEEIGMALNTISFAVIPVVAAQDHTATFAIRAPGGEEATYSYRYKERTYSWLPFLFLNPGFVSAGLDSYERSYQEEQLELYDVIVTRFVQDATLFMQAHRMNAIKPRGEVL